MERELYEEMYNNEDNHWWFVGRRMIVQKILNKFSNHQTTEEVLEVGCGTGGNLNLLSDYGNLYALEMDEKARELANRRKITEVKNGRLPENFPFENDFDLICLLDVLEHIDDDLTTLKALSARLNEKGKILITVPAYNFLWSQHDIINHHKRRYLLSQLKNIVYDSGFEVIYSTYFNTFLFPAICTTRFINNLIRKKRGSDIEMPPIMLNSILTKIFSCERFLLPQIFFPFGVSILVLAEKPFTTKA